MQMAKSLGIWTRLATVACAAAAALIPLPAAWVERGYSTFLYPRIQRPLTAVSNMLPFVLLDALIVVAILGSIGAIGLDVRRRPRHLGRVVGRLIARTAVSAAALYLVFLAIQFELLRCAGRQVVFDAAAITPDAASAADGRTTGTRRRPAHAMAGG